MSAQPQALEGAEDITPPPKLERIYHLLLQAYGKPDWCPDGDALGGLVGTILSQHTSDVNSGRAYSQLVAAFPNWEAVRDAPVEQVAQAIRVGGLANLKAQRIQEVLRVLTNRLKVNRSRWILWSICHWQRRVSICARCRAWDQRRRLVSCSFRLGLARLSSRYACAKNKQAAWLDRREGLGRSGARDF